MQRVVKRPLAFIGVGASLDAVAELCIGPASRRVELIRLDPPAEADKVEVRRPGPGMFSRAAVAAALAAVKVDLPPRVKDEDTAVAAAVFLEQRPGLLVSSIEALPARESFRGEEGGIGRGG